MNDKIKALEREVELLQKVLELTKQIEELKAKQPVYVPYVPYQPWQPYQPSQWWEYKPSTTVWTSGFITTVADSDTVAWYDENGQLKS